MVEMKSGLNDNISRVDADLEIMEAHAADLAAAEHAIRESMKKWDREYKDSHFHSVPKGKKHQR